MKLRVFAPLSETAFRRIWSASLLSNFGYMVLGVGAAWHMVQLTSSPTMVALVQSSLMLPLMLVAMPAGAVADMFDRRKIAMLGLGFALISAATLTLLTIFGLASPWVLLAFCFLIGTGVAFYSPSWQASIPEQVSREHLPTAVALGSISFNIARSFGPAIGGLIVATYGTIAVFSTTAAGYLPLLLAFFVWKRQNSPPRLPPERLDRAIVSGIRHAFHTPLVRMVIIHAASYGLAAGAVTALTPLVARDLLAGNASTFGVLLGSIGVGAIIGATIIGWVRDNVPVDRALALCKLNGTIAMLILAFSHHIVLSCAALVMFGMSNMLVAAMLNVTIQLSVPRWVVARALSLYSSAIAGGIAIGAWSWGNVASAMGVTYAIAGAASLLFLIALVGRFIALRDIEEGNLEPVDMRNDPDVALAITERSGPIAIEIEYRVDPANARQFYDAMLKMQQSRKRNGAFNWSLGRDLADVALWTEHYQFPTWSDYLRNRERMTATDRALQDAADSLCIPSETTRVRRRLQRPYGSVRWKADTPDHGTITDPLQP